MNKLKYLFELDSVCKTEYEIEMAQNRLFKEILVKGNKVVLSYNQLTDSRAFIISIENKESYEKIISLFKLGILKVNVFNEVRTPSQYVQMAVEKCIKGEYGFLFSGIPVKSEEKYLLNLILNALRYSDISLLEEYFLSVEEDKEKERLDFIIRYIKMILILSTDNLSLHKSYNQTSVCFTFIMGIILNFLKCKFLISVKNNDYNSDILSFLDESIDVLYYIKNNFSNDDFINSRSFWIGKISNVSSSEEVKYLSEVIVNLCYNYTIQLSVENVYLPYDNIESDKFYSDFVVRFSHYWKIYNEGNHIFCQSENYQSHYVKNVTLPKWETASRIISKTSSYSLSKKLADNTTVSKVENNKMLDDNWKKVLYRYFFTMFLSTLYYMMSFFFIVYVLGELQSLAISHSSYFGTFFSILIFTVVFGFLGSLIPTLLKLPDILESIKGFSNGFRDLKVVCDVMRKLK